jgi:hypothetical protein
MRLTLLLLLAACEAHGTAYQEKVDAVNDFCRATRISLDSDLRALESGDPKLQAFTTDLVAHEMVHHGYTSVAMCVKRVPPTPENWTFCGINKDYACVANQVRAYRDALRKAGY